MVCQCQGSQELAPELSAKRKRACPASILSARLLFAAVSVQGVAGLHSFGETSARDVFDGEDSDVDAVGDDDDADVDEDDDGLDNDADDVDVANDDDDVDVRMAASRARECGMSVLG